MKTDVTIDFINADTKVEFGKSMGKYWIAFKPNIPGSKSKYKGISPANAKIARALAAHFTCMAEAYEKEEK